MSWQYKVIRNDNVYTLRIEAIQTYQEDTNNKDE